ncbi:MAG: hypothetical protein HQL57_11510 [Magnetococcales bacterium]|nr:hypothetical protein [Magnetococcales bacterium]MBF0157800.1 hypothetical protein [Magnetococcales bacterium]
MSGSRGFSGARRSEAGAVILLMGLAILVIMTLFALSSMNIATTDFKIIGNMQMQRQIEAAAQQAIEQVISDADNFGTAAVGKSLDVDGFTVTTSKPVCIGSGSVSGFSAAWGMSPEDNIWEFKATVQDASSGANAVIWQGIRMRMLAGNCS